MTKISLTLFGYVYIFTNLLYSQNNSKNSLIDFFYLEGIDNKEAVDKIKYIISDYVNKVPKEYSYECSFRHFRGINYLNNPKKIDLLHKPDKFVLFESAKNVTVKKYDYAKHYLLWDIRFAPLVRYVYDKGFGIGISKQHENKYTYFLDKERSVRFTEYDSNYSEAIVENLKESDGWFPRFEIGYIFTIDDLFFRKGGDSNILKQVINVNKWASSNNKCKISVEIKSRDQTEFSFLPLEENISNIKKGYYDFKILFDLKNIPRVLYAEEIYYDYPKDKSKLEIISRKKYTCKYKKNNKTHIPNEALFVSAFRHNKLDRKIEFKKIRDLKHNDNIEEDPIPTGTYIRDKRFGIKYMRGEEPDILTLKMKKLIKKIGQFLRF